MANLVLRRNLANGPVPNNISMSGAVADLTLESAAVDIAWRFEDEPTTEWQFLTSHVGGHEAVVPFDLKGRPVRLSMISRTSSGVESARSFDEGEQTVVYPPTPPTLIDVEYLADAEVEVTFTNNGGVGQIRIHRSIDGSPYVEIDDVAPTAITMTDFGATLDGTYSYKLTQDNIAGESNIKSDVVSGESAGTGSAPSGLSGVWDDINEEADLTWTNNSGTGSNVIERRVHPFANFAEVGSVASSATAFSESITPGPNSQTYIYRVKNLSVVGYSNEAEVFIPSRDFEV